MIYSRLFAVVALLLMLAGCGQTGPLYLPGDDEPEPMLDAEQQQELDEETESSPNDDG